MEEATLVRDTTRETVADEQQALERAIAHHDAHTQELASSMLAVHLSRVDEMPRIELYLDQLLQMVESELSFLRLSGETLVTGSMVNNYVKQRVVPAPSKHRYTRRHLTTVIMVVAFKRVYSLAQIGGVIKALQIQGVDMPRAYDEVCSALECSLKEQFAVGTDFTVPGVEPVVRLWDTSGRPVSPVLARLIEAAIVSLATKIYVEQTLALYATPADMGLLER